ncbi:MAG: tyrosine-type recombinase/integrase, partial [Desulfobacterales bacterium]
MKTGQNYNHPPKGSTIKVEPIRSKRDIQTIKKLLADKPLDLALFTVGINTNLRASDLLRIKVKQEKGLNPNDEIVLNEKKTKKERRINLNKACIEAINGLLASKEYSDEDYLFMGQRGKLTVPTVNAK